VYDNSLLFTFTVISKIKIRTKFPTLMLYGISLVFKKLASYLVGWEPELHKYDAAP
jgi:hypothetical protein